MHVSKIWHTALKCDFWFKRRRLFPPLKPIHILLRHNVIAKQSKIQQPMISWILLWFHPLKGKPKKKKKGISSIYSDIADKSKTQTKKKIDAMDNFVHVSLFCPQRTRWQTRDNTVRDVTGQKKIDCSFVVPGTWYVSPSLVSMDERRQHRKTHL